MPSHRALAFWHDPARVKGHAEAFAAGCKRHGVPCEVLRSSDAFAPAPGVDVIFHYGLRADLGGIPFEIYAGHAIRIGGDAGYFRWMAPASNNPDERPIRISLEGPQVGELMKARPHQRERFDRLRIQVQPVRARGKYILVCGRSKWDAKVSGMRYGEWEAAMCERMKAITKRPIMLREKPKNELIPVAGVQHDSQRDCNQSIRGAWAVVCRGGNVGADAILHGVPCFAESGPGAIYQKGRLEDIDQAQPLSADERIAALADIAHWQWSNAEISRGDLWAHLRDEGVL